MGVSEAQVHAFHFARITGDHGRGPVYPHAPASPSTTLRKPKSKSHPLPQPERRIIETIHLPSLHKPMASPKASRKSLPACLPSRATSTSRSKPSSDTPKPNNNNKKRMRHTDADALTLGPPRRISDTPPPRGLGPEETARYYAMMLGGAHPPPGTILSSPPSVSAPRLKKATVEETYLKRGRGVETVVDLPTLLSDDGEDEDGDWMEWTREGVYEYHGSRSPDEVNVHEITPTLVIGRDHWSDYDELATDPYDVEGGGDEDEDEPSDRESDSDSFHSTRSRPEQSDQSQASDILSSPPKAPTPKEKSSKRKTPTPTPTPDTSNKKSLLQRSLGSLGLGSAKNKVLNTLGGSKEPATPQMTSKTKAKTKGGPSWIVNTPK